MQTSDTLVNFDVKKCTSVNELSCLIDELDKGDYFIVDVDDTLITTQAMMFRKSSPFVGFLDNLKKQAPSNLADVLSSWRLNRKSILIEQQWPEILKKLKNKGVTVLALTQVNTGKFGKIDSIEKWRANELKQMQLEFSTFAADEVKVLIDGKAPATMFQGILFTSCFKKAEVLQAFIGEHHQPSRVVFFDDRLEQAEDIAKFCKNAGIECHSYHYLAASQLPYDAALDFGSIQTQMILNQKWAEDDQIKQTKNKSN